MVDDQLVEQADLPPVPAKAPGQTAVLRRLIPLAACLCLGAGAVLAWRVWPGLTAEQGSAIASTRNEQPQSEGTLPFAANAPETGSDSTADAPDTGLDPSLAQLILPAAGSGGSGPDLAADLSELGLADAGLPAESGSLPQTLPLYQNAAAEGGVDRDSLQALMEQTLSDLSLDPALAEQATLVWNLSQDQVDNADAIAEELRSRFGVTSELDFWAGLASLELTLPDGATLTVDNDRRITLTPAEQSVTRALTREDLTGSTPLTSVLEALGGYTREEQPLIGRSWTDGRLLDQSLTLGRGLAPGSLIGVQLDQQGNLAGFTLSGSAQVVQRQDCPVISLDRALTLLEEGRYLTQISGSPDPDQGSIVDARLCYLEGRCLYYLPMWRFAVDFGSPEDPYPDTDPDTGAPLRAYYVYYLPAVEPDLLAELLGG